MMNFNELPRAGAYLDTFTTERLGHRVDGHSLDSSLWPSEHKYKALDQPVLLFTFGTVCSCRHVQKPETEEKSFPFQFYKYKKAV
jgi:hypothetical protein